MRHTDFDVARAISIMLVVFGHSLLSQMHPALNDALTCVRMPLFLMLSGVFFKPSVAAWATAQRKADALLKPYLVMALALGLASWATGKFSDPSEFILAALSFNGPPLQNGMYPLWFLSWLWLVHVAATLLYRVTRFQQRSVAWRLCLVLTLLVLGHAALPYAWDPQRCVSVGLGYIGLPFSADLLPVGLAWFLLGHILGPSLRSQPMPLTGTLACSGVFVASQLLGHPVLNLYMREASDMSFTSVAGLSGALAILGWCRMASHMAGLAPMLAPVGRHSLYVLMWHAPLQRMLSQQLQTWWPQHQEAACWVALPVVVIACSAGAELVRRQTALRLCFEPWPQTQAIRDRLAPHGGKPA
jgi:fucose 4-O-acetylase-like acetyltransferase